MRSKANDPAAAEPAEEHDRLAQPVHGEEGPRLPFPVVGIGASAGGIEAFVEFFDAMPASPGIALVLVQHLSPDHESKIAEILSKHTEMPVAQIDDRMRIEPNHVYVIRPGHTLTIKNGELHLGAVLKEPGNNRPVDDFFRSLAEEQRERAICIIMSGMGSNGTAGAEQIKAVGGLAIAQDLDSAKFPSMPRHLIESGNADLVLRPSEMPATLLRYVAHPYVKGEAVLTAAQQERQQLADVLSVVRARTRRDFSNYKKPTVLRRIYRRMGLNQIEGLDHYAKYLRHNPVEVSALVDDLMINVTGFFRDPAAWDALQEEVIVPLVTEREAEDEIRCWVTACSSGEEAYTLAMLLLEAAEDADKRLDMKVFATDTAERTLSRARMGIYPMGIESEISADRLARFFEKEDAVYRVKRELREMVVFAPQDVIQDPPFSRLDICTCRNLLIYLEPALQRRVLGLLHFGLREGGALFLGSSETIADAKDLFEPIDKRARIYRRVGARRPDLVEFVLPRSSGEGGEGQSLHAAVKPSISHVTDRVLLDRHTPPSVTVNRQHQVVYFHGNTDLYLTQPPGEPTRDLLPMVRESVRGAVRTALQRAMADQKTATIQDGVVESAEGRLRVAVTVEPIDHKLAAGHYLVTFRQRELPTPTAPAGAEGGEDPTQLRDELQRVRDELQSTIEELQTSNEELKASNEEAMSINEELQSTNEELQTSKEELQSLNEELTTVNAQLQDKIEEHEATTSDLKSLLSSTDIAVVFLDTRLRIRRFTPAIRDLLELIPSDVGRPLSDMANKFADVDLLADAQAVLDKLVPIEKEVTSGSGHVYLRRITPYRTSDNRIDGVVITFIDISGRKEAELALDASEQRLRLVLDNAPDFAMLLLDSRGRIVTWNVGAERLLGWSASEVVGKSAAIVYPPETGAAQLQAEMQRAAEAGRAADETWHVRKSGARLWGSGVLTAVRDAEGELTGFVKVLRDETARQQAETERSQLLESEQFARQEAESATKLKDQFLATLSHELRTPLASMMIWVKMLKQGMCDDDEREEGLDVIERSVESQKQLLDDLLDTSRIATGKVRLDRSEVDIAALVRRCVDSVKPFAKSKELSVHSRLAGDVGKVSADEGRMKQVIDNLLSNAVKFTPAGGRFDVELKKLNGWVELRVTDSGEGIDADFLPNIFAPFTQAQSPLRRESGGLGLGLAICKELVELHGGTIAAESEGVGKGATFVVRLPRAAPAGSPTKKSGKPAAKRVNKDVIQGARILLVEDEAKTRQALVKLLKKAGAEVTAVVSARTAHEAFEEQPPDLIISDIGLPDEDGYQLLQKIRVQEMEKELPATPAIALTAFAASKDRHQAREAGFHKHVAKPVAPATLLAAVGTLLAERELVR